MDDLSQIINEIEGQIEKGLWDLELKAQLEQAMQVYRQAEAKLAELNIAPDDSAFGEGQRVLSYCLMRQENLLRQMGQPQEALALGAREIAAARASGDVITLARALMSNGTNLILTGGSEPGLRLLEEARELFESGESIDHKQGLGWYWILQADLANAGLVKREPSEVIGMATRALEILEPIENWPGVARAYAARANAHEKKGDMEAAAQERREQEVYERKIKSD